MQLTHHYCYYVHYVFPGEHGSASYISVLALKLSLKRAAVISGTELFMLAPNRQCQNTESNKTGGQSNLTNGRIIVAKPNWKSFSPWSLSFVDGDASHCATTPHSKRAVDYVPKQSFAMLFNQQNIPPKFPLSLFLGPT